MACSSNADQYASDSWGAYISPLSFENLAANNDDLSFAFSLSIGWYKDCNSRTGSPAVDFPRPRPDPLPPDVARPRPDPFAFVLAFARPRPDHFAFVLALLFAADLGLPFLPPSSPESPSDLPSSRASSAQPSNTGTQLKTSSVSSTAAKSRYESVALLAPPLGPTVVSFTIWPAALRTFMSSCSVMYCSQLKVAGVKRSDESTSDMTSRTNLTNGALSL